jgi:hypothetical protein
MHLPVNMLMPAVNGWAARLGGELARRVHLVVDVCARDARVAGLERRAARVKTASVAAEVYCKLRFFLLQDSMRCWLCHCSGAAARMTLHGCSRSLACE